MLKVCLFRRSRRFASTRIESGVSRSMQPSRVCSNCAAVDNFLFVLRFGLSYKKHRYLIKVVASFKFPYKCYFREAEVGN